MRKLIFPIEMILSGFLIKKREDVEIERHNISE